MPLSNYSRDNFVSQHLSELDANNAPPLFDRYRKKDTWLDGFVLTHILQLRFEPRHARFVFALVRRCISLIEEYESGRASLESYVCGQKGLSVYFRCLHHFEACIGMLYQSYDLIRRLTGEDLFQNKDGSAVQRLNSLYNEGRHFNLDNLPEGQLHAIWVANDGLHAAECSVTFEELHEMAVQVCSIAEMYSSAKGINEATERAADNKRMQTDRALPDS
jgi:hypothetical protein